MTTDYTKPEVYSISPKQGLLMGMMALPLLLLIGWISLGEIDGFVLWLSLSSPVVMYAMSPRVVLAPEGISVTILRIPWIARTPWFKLGRAGMPHAGNWVWIERLDETSGWIWIPSLKIDGEKLLERIADRYTHHFTEFCHHCEYNLQGNTSGACPECGNAKPQASSRLRVDIQPKPGS